MLSDQANRCDRQQQDIRQSLKLASSLMVTGAQLPNLNQDLCKFTTLWHSLCLVRKSLMAHRPERASSFIYSAKLIKRQIEAQMV